MRVLIVVVLFNQSVESARAVRSLTSALAEIDQRDRFDVVIIDNTPYKPPSELSRESQGRYVALGRNAGLSVAYNLALSLAHSENFTHLITLDQDSLVTREYIEAVFRCIPQAGTDVVAWVPTVVSIERVVSPFFYNRFGLPRYNYSDKGTFAINSFSVYDVEYLRAVNGFDEYYWLDSLDLSVFALMSRHGKRCNLLPVTVQHELSLVVGGTSLCRMGNIAKYEASFFCEFMTPMQFTVGFARAFVRGLKVIISSSRLMWLPKFAGAMFYGAITGLKRRWSRFRYA